tara:strand:+ start:247 stop:708 length:462 start_codon:yes stop_codon:yes gene_type:complete
MGNKNKGFKDFSEKIDKYQIIKSKGQFKNNYTNSYDKEETAYYIKKNSRLINDYSAMLRFLGFPLMASVVICMILSLASFLIPSISYGEFVLYSYLPLNVLSMYLIYFSNNEFKLFFKTQREAEIYINDLSVDTKKKSVDKGEVVKEILLNKN